MISRHIRAAVWAAVLLPALAGAVPAAAEPGLLERCWPAGALTAREGEREPAKGAAGHAQRIPRLAQSATSPPPQPIPGVVRRVAVPAGKKLIALTLDLCEQPGEIAGYDGAIFDYLRANRIKATVFTGGKWLMTHAERAQQLIADPLLELGNHGWAHRNVRGLAGGDLAQEIRGPEAAFQLRRADLAPSQCGRALPVAIAALQPRLGLYRFPFGACNAEAQAVLAANGLVAIQWDVSTGDSSKAESAEAIARTLLADVRPGSIILAHANGRGHHTAAALPIAIPKLKAQGYSFVTVSELLATGKPVTTDTCYDHRPGDTDRYDALFQRRPQRPESADGRATPSALPR